MVAVAYYLVIDRRTNIIIVYFIYFHRNICMLVSKKCKISNESPVFREKLSNSYFLLKLNKRLYVYFVNNILQY